MKSAAKLPHTTRIQRGNHLPESIAMAKKSGITEPRALQAAAAARLTHAQRVKPVVTFMEHHASPHGRVQRLVEDHGSKVVKLATALRELCQAEHMVYKQAHHANDALQRGERAQPEPGPGHAAPPLPQLEPGDGPGADLASLRTDDWAVLVVQPSLADPQRSQT